MKSSRLGGKGLESEVGDIEEPYRGAVQQLIHKLEILCLPRQVQFPSYDFTLQEVQGLLHTAQAAYWALGGSSTDIVPPDVDAPLPFDAGSLIRNVEAMAQILSVAEHVETLLFVFERS